MHIGNSLPTQSLCRFSGRNLNYSNVRCFCFFYGEEAQILESDDMSPRTNGCYLYHFSFMYKAGVVILVFNNECPDMETSILWSWRLNPDLRHVGKCSTAEPHT